MVDTPLKAEEKIVARRGRRSWLLLLAIPYVALCFPQMYTRMTPVLWGFPFFYWYQFVWVLITSAILGIVYKLTREGTS